MYCVVGLFWVEGLRARARTDTTPPARWLDCRSDSKRKTHPEGDHRSRAARKVTPVGTDGLPVQVVRMPDYALQRQGCNHKRAE